MSTKLLVLSATLLFSRALAALPEDVEKREVVIFSDGTRMAGDLYLPKGLKPEDKRPAIVLCAGTGGTKGGSGARLGAIFAQNGCVALAFDDRGWGGSDSKLITTEKQPRPAADGNVAVKVGYEAGTLWASEGLAEAALVHDRFHTSAHLNDTVAAVHREENRRLQKLGDDRLKGTQRLFENIIPNLRHPITNAVTEGLNSKIQAIKANARGFRSFINYRTRILFCCGKLDLYPL